MSLFEDTYFTVERPCEGLFRDKGSKFIAYVFPFEDESRLKEIVAELKAMHPKARHHCWAYRLGTDRSVFRINDDGEPSGTAGRPILNVLLSKDVTNILVVVVRYFGGTLLGVPGLINAYKSATVDALEQAEVVERTVKDVYEIRFDYVQMNDVMRIIKDENIFIVDQQFDNSCVVLLGVRKMQVNTVIRKFDKLLDVETKYLYTI